MKQQNVIFTQNYVKNRNQIKTKTFSEKGSRLMGNLITKPENRIGMITDRIIVQTDM